MHSMSDQFTHHHEGTETKVTCKHCGQIMDSSATGNHHCPPIITEFSAPEEAPRTITATSASSADAPPVDQDGIKFSS